MPIPILIEVFLRGFENVPFLLPALKIAACLTIIYYVRVYFSGAKTTSERVMHSKVIMITGGTSGIGATTARLLAERGAQIILLTHHPGSDPFLIEYISDLRASTNNELIYAEQLDLSSLHSIRKFATKWIDNAPPRRLDIIILCADTQTPRFGVSKKLLRTEDELDPVWQVNYLGSFHLLSILSPALRAQPPDRDVRVVFATCASYVGGDLSALKDSREPLPKGKEYATSKLATMVFAQAFQRHLDAYKRPDGFPMNTRVVLVDPGLTRTPGLRRWLSMGSVWGLMLYVLMWPLWWLVLKSPEMGAQGLLMAAMEADLGKGRGGRFLKECKDWKFLRGEVEDEKVQKKLWEFSDKLVEVVEKEGVARRKREKAEERKAEKKAVGEQGNGGQAPETARGSTDGTRKEEPPVEKAGKVKSSRRSRKVG